MTMREFWHDIRERLTDDRSPRRHWRGEHYRSDPWRGRELDRSEGSRYGRPEEGYRWERQRAIGNSMRGETAEWRGQRYMNPSGGFISDADDLPLYTGGTWNPGEGSRDWRGRPSDDYGQYAPGSAELGWPDRYASTFYAAGYRGRGPQNWRRADERIREDVCELMTEDDELDPSEIEVAVQNGEVTLTGTVENRGDKRHAEYLAERVSGVRDVHNRLQVQRERDTFLGNRQALAGSSFGSSNTRQ